MNKPKLVPVRVEWCISAAVPFLTVTVHENDRVVIEFLANFRENDEQEEHKVIITYSHQAWVKITPAIFEKPTMSEEAFDWSEVRPRMKSRVDEWLKEFNELWRSNGWCPDPGMYEVQNSEWLELTKASQLGYKHYLFRGEDVIVEILGREWEYCLGERVNWLK